jgi:hypothetical protein
MPNIPWDWHCISQNPNITWDIVKDNRDKPWSNEVINARFILNDYDLSTCLNRYINKNNIKKMLVMCHYNPKHKICLNRMLYCFND